MGYNLLKSLYIKAGKTDFEYSIDFTTKGCCLIFYEDSNHNYSVTLKFKYLPDVKEGHSDTMSNKVANVGYILNDSLKSSIKESWLKPFDAFDNVIRLGQTIYIFQVDNFSLKLSEELYSTPANMLAEQFSNCRYHCKMLTDFGVVTDFSSLSTIEIALKLIEGENIVYQDNGRYKIVLTDKGKAMITRYKIAKGL